MTLAESALLGIVQGLTEFLPISSSGHLVLLQNILGFTAPEIFFDACLHVGTLMAVCVFLRKDLLEILRALFKTLKSPSFPAFKDAYRNDAYIRLLALTFLGTVVTVILVLVFEKRIEEMFASVATVGAALIVTGFILWATRWARPSRKDALRTGAWSALAIGVAQSVAVTPGISRSGATISCALFLGLERELAVRLSFLFSIPAILGAVVLQFNADIAQFNSANILAGTLCAALSGFFALKILAWLVNRGSLWVFAPYCWAVGIVTLLTVL